jgi:AcrR family transcriptional regulator
MTATAELGLRERKKAATRQALSEAALRLAIEHGAERLTVEAIADDVGVSRRTFSNYFASKEEALLYNDTQRMRALVDIVRSRPAEESPWTALTVAANEFYSGIGELDPATVAQGRLVRSQPALVAAQVQAFAAFERELAVEIASRRTDGSPVRARLTAAVFLAAMRVSLQVWTEQSSEQPSEQSSGRTLGELVEESLAEAGWGFQ